MLILYSVIVFQIIWNIWNWNSRLTLNWRFAQFWRLWYNLEYQIGERAICTIKTFLVQSGTSDERKHNLHPNGVCGILYIIRRAETDIFH